jgi:hypothetical protein
MWRSNHDRRCGTAIVVDRFARWEHDRLDEWGNRAVLTEPDKAVSIAVLFDAQVARAPEAPR